MSQVAPQNIRSLPSHQGSDGHDPLQISQQNKLRAFFARVLPKNWDRAIVNEKIDSVTMPKWIASAILIAMLAFIGQSWWARSNDHDAMIRIEQKLEDSQKAVEKAETEQKARNGDMAAWQGVMNGNYKEIIGMLRQEQIDSLNKLPRGKSQQPQPSN